MDNNNSQKAYQEIEKCIKEIKNQIKKACRIADHSAIEFSFNFNDIEIEYAGEGSPIWVQSDDCTFENGSYQPRPKSEWKYKLRGIVSYSSEE